MRGLHCLICNDKIYSKSTYDFVRCKCGDCFVDGGQEATIWRYGHKSDKFVIITSEDTPCSSSESTQDAKAPL